LSRQIRANVRISSPLVYSRSKIVGKLTKPKSNRITILEKRIKWLEEGYPRRRRGSNNKSSDDDNNVSSIIIQLKQELADLLEEDAKTDKLRCLPLYSCRITGWKSYVQNAMIRSICIVLQSP
jgi:hypothetical protein